VLSLSNLLIIASYVSIFVENMRETSGAEARDLMLLFYINIYCEQCRRVYVLDVLLKWTFSKYSIKGITGDVM
jgi:hypothetical protein